MATMVTARLTQGPQIMAPAMMVMANNGKNDLPQTKPMRDKDSCFVRLMLRSFLARLAVR
jgi:hypothetical protein